MGDDLKRRMIERMRAVRHLMNCQGEHPGGQDGTKRQVVLPGAVVSLAQYGELLETAYRDENETHAKQLMAAVL